MTIVHGELFQTSIATASLLAIEPVTSGGDKVKDLPAPMFLGLIAYSPDAQYATLHNPDAFQGTDPAISVPGDSLTGVNRKINWNNAKSVPTNTQYFFKAYQDSGAGQEVNGILWHSYGKGRSIRTADARGIPTGRRISKGSSLGADSWNAVNSISDLKEKSNYALTGALAVSSDARAVRFEHNDFDGLKPTLPGVSDVNRLMPRFADAPIFSGGSDLNVEGFVGTSQDMTVIVELVEVS